MENKTLLEKGEAKVEFSGTDLRIVLDTKGVDITVAVDAEYFLRELTEKIPGQVDDTVVSVLIAALKG